MRIYYNQLQKEAAMRCCMKSGTRLGLLWSKLQLTYSEILFIQSYKYVQWVFTACYVVAKLGNFLQKYSENNFGWQNCQL